LKGDAVKLSIRRLTRASLVLFISGAFVWPAYPAGLRCRSDPLVLLSDGTLLDLSADFDGMLWDIKAVEYTIRVPSTTKVLLVLPTPNWPGTLEKIIVRSDMPAKTYDTRTIVWTRNANAKVTAHLLVRPLLSLLPSMKSVTGLQGQSIPVKIVTR
jgi:hypothetical protein